MSNRQVTFQGNPLILLGNPVEVGVAAPIVQLLNDELKGARMFCDRCAGDDHPKEN